MSTSTMTRMGNYDPSTSQNQQRGGDSVIYLSWGGHGDCSVQSDQGEAITLYSEMDL